MPFDPLRDACARCGKPYDEHPGGFCPDAVDASGTVHVETVPSYEVPEDEGDAL